MVRSIYSSTSWLQIPQIIDPKIPEGLNNEPLKNSWRIKSHPVRLGWCRRAPDTHPVSPQPLCFDGARGKDVIQQQNAAETAGLAGYSGGLS